VEGVLWRDLEVGRTPRLKPFRGRRNPTRFSPSRPVRRSPNPQRNVAVAMRGRRGVLVYEERRGARDQILLARTRNGGRTWSRPMRPTGRTRGSTDEWWPAVALGNRGRVTVAWVDRSSGRERVYIARSRSGGRRFGRPAPVDASPQRDVAQWKPALAQGSGDTVHAAFVDERARHPDGGLPQAGVFYTRVRAGVPERARRVDGGTPTALATKLDNAWAPSVTSRGDQVLITWLDFREYDWDVIARRSSDGGQGFGTERPVNDTPASDEALNDTPRAVFTSEGPFVAWTDWRKRDSASLVPHPFYDTFVAAPGGRNVQADPYAARQVSTFSPAPCAVGRDLLVAYQDASSGQNDVRVARVAGGVRRGRSRRIDDAGRRGGNAWRPQLACSRGRVLAAWEDERDGPSQVYVGRARATRLR